jgi:hypothetical protein
MIHLDQALNFADIYTYSGSVNSSENELKKMQ